MLKASALKEYGDCPSCQRGHQPHAKSSRPCKARELNQPRNVDAAAASSQFRARVGRCTNASPGWLQQPSSQLVLIKPQPRKTRAHTLLNQRVTSRLFLKVCFTVNETRAHVGRQTSFGERLPLSSSSGGGRGGGEILFCPFHVRFYRPLLERAGIG